MIYTLGIDIGSTTSKGVLLKNGTELTAHALIKAGTGTDGPKKVMEQILQEGQISLSDIAYTVATGYGRFTLPESDCEMSELSCHAKGIAVLHPEVRTIIDIGGQDAKVININKNGYMMNFAMNDKCAAGTGRFLDVMAGILQINVGELEDYALRSENPAKISSTCTVFAESEVISQLANGTKKEDVIAGICNSVGSRTAALVKRIGVVEQAFMSGGVAKNGGVRKALEKELRVSINYSDFSQMMGAYGAAVFAYEKYNNQK